jgi:hypothetical protein
MPERFLEGGNSWQVLWSLWHTRKASKIGGAGLRARLLGTEIPYIRHSQTVLLTDRLHGGLILLLSATVILVPKLYLGTNQHPKLSLGT